LKKLILIGGVGVGLVATGSIPAQASGGGTIGNGGGAIVCTRPDGSLDVRLLDLVEAERGVDIESVPRPRLTIPRSDEPKQVQLERALAKLAAAGAPELVERMRRVLRDLRRIPIAGDYQLPPPVDTNLRFMRRERSCSLQGVARFHDDTGSLEIDTDLEAEMSPTDQAALDFHEAAYKVFRGGVAKARDSVAARRLTAAMFASEEFRMPPPFEGVRYATFRCTSSRNGYEFYVIPQAEGRIRLQFEKIAGENVSLPATFAYNPRPDQPHDTPSDVKTLIRRLATGFPETETVDPTNRASRTYAGKVVAFEPHLPEYRMALRVSDFSWPCPRNSGGCYVRRPRPFTLYYNYEVSLEMLNDPNRTREQVSCRPL
jgi:hypothetical protein